MKLNQEQIDGLKSSHPEGVAFLTMGGQQIALRMPSEREVFAFIDTISNDKKSKARAQKTIVLTCVAFPSREEAEAILAAKPVRYQKAFEAAWNLADDGDEEEDYDGKKDES